MAGVRRRIRRINRNCYDPSAMPVTTSIQIKNLEDIINPYIGNNNKVVRYSTKNLTQPGENYGSTMLFLNVTITDKNGTEKDINMVAKLPPPTEILWSFFNTEITFKKEVNVYLEIMPILVNFQKENNVPDNKCLNILPKCYGARFTLQNDSNVVDEDAILILENLKILGYSNVNRMIGFNFDQTKDILKQLARLHAVPIALKKQKPHIFKEKIMPNLQKVLMGSEVSISYINSMKILLKKIIEKNDSCRKYLSLVMEKIDKTPEEDIAPPSEPFGTFVHADLWVNNIMIKQPNDIKFVDFQLIYYGSPVRDLLFFLFTSVQKNVIDNNFDSFIHMYHNYFEECLQELNCDEINFSRECFMKEVYNTAHLEFTHIIVMLSVLCSEPGQVPELEKMGKDNFFHEDRLGDLYETRVIDTILKFVEMGYLKC